MGLPYIEPGSTSNGHIFYIITRSLDERTQLIEYLKKNGILAVFHYVPLHSSPAGTRYGRVSGDMKTTNDLSNRLLRLPLYYEMTDEDVTNVVKTIEKFYRI